MKALLAAATRDHVALAALGEHALADNASADCFVAGVTPAHQQGQ